MAADDFRIWKRTLGVPENMQFPLQMIRLTTAACLLLLVTGMTQAAPITVTPEAVQLRGPESTQQLLLTSQDQARHVDRTRDATYRSADESIVTVTPEGRLIAQADGKSIVRMMIDDQLLEVAVEVSGVSDPAPISFRHQVIPILSKAGCNSSGCHGKAEGQNGFKLSVFGFAVEEDHDSISRESRGRRVNTAAPHESLLLAKAAAVVPHGGGQRVLTGSLWYQRMTRWISEGAELDQPSPGQTAGIEVLPKRLLLGPNNSFQLVVTALDAEGNRRCVTAEAEFQSNAIAIGQVDHEGIVRTAEVPGEAAILVRYMGHVAVCRLTIPQQGVAFNRPAENNAIDGLVWDKLTRLGIAPSELADDATFLRRVYLDTIGTLPTVDEARRFLTDKSADKRGALISHLLECDEYADYWALRWADLLRVDKERVTSQGAVAMTRWLREQFAQNRPYDEFVQEVVTARGNTFAESPAAFYQVHETAEKAARSISQLFLGVRIECAQCHHHPFEKWGQKDYYALAGFFTGVSQKGGPSGGTKILLQAGKDLNHPRSGEPVAAAGLGAEPSDLSSVADRRQALFQWMAADDNPMMARMIANRLWAHYLGRGLVEPIDDMRATNPASNEPLLEFLAEQLVAADYDLKSLIRLILNSRVYQLDNVPTESNELDQQNFSHAIWKPMPAEVLLDAICQVSGRPEQFNGWPEGYRAIQIWDNRLPSYFFQIFGRPQRVSVCECERGNEPSIAQALHLMNSPESVRKIRHRDGRAAGLSRTSLAADKLIEELYLAALSRYPSPEEVILLLEAFNSPESVRRQAVEDVMWVLLNTREFVYNH
jgi:hypothetical protein